MTIAELAQEPAPRGVLPPIGKALIAARESVRAMGNDRAVKSLVSASAGMPDQVAITFWRDGTFSTAGGDEDEPGQGVEWRGQIEDYVGRLNRYAFTVHAKGTGLVLTHGRSRYGGSADMECLERSWIFGDADGVGDPDAIEWALRAAGIAFVIQRRNADRFHLEIPLSEPLIPGDDPAEWKHERYMPELGHVLGVLSEIGELSCRDQETSISHLGFDAATSRLLQLRFPVCRRERSDDVPVTVWNEGNALSWNHLLLETAYRAELYAGMRRAHRAGESDEAWLRALSHDGKVTKALRGSKYALECPWAGAHSTGKPGDTSTVLFSDGTWHCSHGSCAARGNGDVFDTLSEAAQRIVIDGLEESARLNPSAAFAPYVLDYALRNDGAEAVAEALRRAGIDVGRWARAALRRGRRTAP